MTLLYRIFFVVVHIILFRYFCSGTHGNKGLVFGTWNPLSFVTFTHIPADSTGSFSNVSWPLTPSTARITSITSDSSQGVIFAAIRDGIYIYQNFSIWQNGSKSILPIYKGKSFAFGQIVFDYISSNLYWCDSLHHWIAMKPAYNVDNAIYKVVIHKGLQRPEGLALDPERRLMFFSDNGPNPRIEKAYLDGQNRGVIVYAGLSRVLSLSVDILNNRLYWVDYIRDTLEVSDYDGSNRRVIKRINGISLTDLFYHQNLLHAVSLENQMVIGVDASSGLLVYSQTFSSPDPFTINVYDAETQRSYNDPCSSLTCDHICVNAQSGPECLCAEGFNLAADKRSCTDKSWFFEKGFLVNNETVFAMHEVHSISGQQRDYHSMKLSSNIIETFAADAKSDIIYFVDSKSNSLKKLGIISEQINTLTSISSRTVTDLVLDWIANLLGWIESHSNIMSFSVNSGSTSTIYSNLQQLDSLTVDAHNGILYWISGITGSRSIVRGTWTRETPKVVISDANLNNPYSLQYDVTSYRLYWIDGSLIKSSMTNGSNIKSHAIAVGATKAFVYKEFFGWINGGKIYFTRQSSTSEEDVWNTVQNSKTVVVFDASLQQDKRGTCDILNGGCEDICIPIENGRRCECDIGLKLQNDNTCDSDVLVTKFIIVTDFSHARLLQINLLDGSIVKLPVTAQGTGVAFDKVTKTVFYTDINQKTIMSTSLHGKDSLLIHTSGFAYASRLAIDYSTGNLYYTAVGSTAFESYIGVVHRTLFVHKTLFSNLDFPREIVLYPSKGYLFWAEIGNKPRIGRAFMDGTTRTDIVTTDLGWPIGLAIDFSANRLYWTDGKADHIESSDLNGGIRRVLATDANARLTSLVIHDEYLYYTAWNRQRIIRMNKATGGKVSFMPHHPELGRLDGMDIYADDFHDESLSCSNNNGLCSKFCFPTPTGRKCGCQDNVNLQSDQITCDGDSKLNQGTTEVTVLTEERNNTFVYVFGGGAGVAVVGVVLIAIFCLMKNRRKRRRDTSTEPGPSPQNISHENPYITFENHGYVGNVNEREHEYSTIEDPSGKPSTIYEEPTNPYAYLSTT